MRRRLFCLCCDKNEKRKMTSAFLTPVCLPTTVDSLLENNTDVGSMDNIPSNIYRLWL